MFLFYFQVPYRAFDIIDLLKLASLVCVSGILEFNRMKCKEKKKLCVGDASVSYVDDIHTENAY